MVELSDDDRQETFSKTLRAMPGYPWLPCPICHYTESCDHTVPERARAAGNFTSGPIRHQ